MHALGLDITDRRIVGVVVDAEGAIVRRARAEGTAAARDVARDLATGLSIDAFGVAIDPAAPDVIVPSADDLPAAVRTNPGVGAVTAEAWIGAAKGETNVVALKIGERVFAGILLDGRPWVGAHGLAGTAGWLALNPVERQDYRKLGGLAAEVSNDGIARRLSWRIQAGDDSPVLEEAGSLDAITAAHVFAGARAGDGVSLSVIRDTGKYIAMALANFACCFDPDVVVLSSDAAAAGDLMFEAVRQDYQRRIPPAMTNRVRLAISSLGDEEVAIGAARVAALGA